MVAGAAGLCYQESGHCRPLQALQAAGLTAATGAGPVQDGSQKSMIAVINPSKIEVLALGEESHFYVEQDVLYLFPGVPSPNSGKID